MSEPRNMRVGATPGKLALIVVLSIALVGVIAKNWPSSSPEEKSPTAEAYIAQGSTSSPTVATTTPTAIAPPEMNKATSDNPFGEFLVDDDWQELPLKEVTKYDPFAIADWAMAAEAGGLAGDMMSEKQINELLAAKDAIIFMTGDKRVARIGKQDFRVGDRIGRYKISDITAKGVVLSAAP
jgi:hypothetical protein